jgi:beta-galactosidase
MLRLGLLLLASVNFLAAFSQVIPSELQTPEIVSVNRMPMRASGFSFENRTLAQQRDKTKSAYFLSLNGNWKFNWVQDPTKRPVDFYKKDFNDANWTDFKVPANWELNGYGLPIYVNHPYEFTGRAKTGARLNPPFDIPDNNNPVGSYRKKITVPADWNGRQVFIHLGAVKSAFFIWVNGQKVGYSEDSKLAAEFDITEYVKPGENLVALQVYRWSDGSYLECQDMWRISGIERDVYLYATPKLNIRDFKVTGTLDGTYTNGLLAGALTIENYKKDSNTLHSKPVSFYVDAELVDADGKQVWKKDGEQQQVLGNYHTKLAFQTRLDKVKTWSAETPYLYTLYLTLKDKDKNVLEVIPQRIGFRSVEIKGSDFLINGKRIFLKGVNRHEHNATQGHVLSKEDMLKDMEMMKKLNVNAVRHSHYPPDPYWMELCDEFGLYVVDEANIESHGRYYDLSTSFGNDKKWRNPHFERIARMYERDKNHTAVVTWSLGNEAGNGVNFYEAYEWLKANDFRPVQYERAENDFNTDMIVPQYPSPRGLINYSKSKSPRPFIMSEYAHIMGNSLGNFKEYWDAIENNPKLQGGFIWEWIDQAIDTVKNGKRIMAYGGDFPLAGPVDENISDNNFCVKGVVTAYRGMTPMAVEVKKVHQFIKTTYKGNNQLDIRNSYFFKTLNNVVLQWQLLEGGKVIESGTINNISIAPQGTQTVTVPVKKAMKAGNEYFLNVNYNVLNAEPFLEKGYTVAYDQFHLANNFTAYQAAVGKGSLTEKESGDNLVISGKDFVVSFDKTKGAINAYTVKQQNILTAGPLPSYWRAPTDNDIGAGFNSKLRNWRNVYEKSATTNFAAVKEGNTYKVSIEKQLLNGDAVQTQVFTIYASGEIKVENSLKAVQGKHELLLRVGNDLVLNKAYSNISWYGRGPGESYWDRKTGSLIGQYKQTVQEQYFPYARPQESGNKADVRWANFTDAKGKGIQIIMADSLLNVAALPYALDDLDPETNKKQYHSGELVPRNEIYLHVDLQQLGVQGIDSWGARPLEEYRLPFKNYQYSYWIKPIK